MSRFLSSAALATGVALFAASEVAHAKAVTLGRTETNTDYVSAGVGGISSGGGTIEIEGVSGQVRKAFLYWHGIDNSGSGQVYDNETVSFAGQDVTGTSLGDASTNCWGSGGSRSFFADVTGLVDGNGEYAISGLNAKNGHSGNGASLIVLFDDGNPNNNRDLVFFEGNDSDIADLSGHPDDLNGWAAVLNDINYTGGSVYAQLHAGDGQAESDGSVTFTGSSPVTFLDDNLHWDGNSVPYAGFGRLSSPQSLWDIHTYDISGAFGAPGEYTINFTGMNGTGDCHSLVALILDLSAGSAPCGNGVFNEGEECDPAGTGDDDCEASETCLNDCTCGCTSDAQCNDGVPCTIDDCNTETGTCINDSSECNFCEGLCGDPVEQFGRISAIDAQFILRASVQLEKCALCVCDVDDSGEILASDALIALRYAVGLPVDLDCPLGVVSTTTSTTLPETTTTTLVDITTTTLVDVTTTTLPETTTTTTLPETTTTTTLPDPTTTTTLPDPTTTTTLPEVTTTTLPEPVCGNGEIEGKEDCDDGNTSDTDSCVGLCQTATCGDGFVQAGVEQCDPGAVTSSPRTAIVECNGKCQFVIPLSRR